MGKGSCHKTSVTCLLLLWARQRSLQGLQACEGGRTIADGAALLHCTPPTKLPESEQVAKLPLPKVNFLADRSSAFSRALQCLKVLLAQPRPAPASGSPAVLAPLARLAPG